MIRHIGSFGIVTVLDLVLGYHFAVQAIDECRKVGINLLDGLATYKGFAVNIISSDNSGCRALSNPSDSNFY